MPKPFLLLLLLIFRCTGSFACSILYYHDTALGKIYAVNNEDYWYDVKPYIKIEPGGNKTFSRLWYGWDNFAQGGINQHGLFFDGATTPDQPPVKGYSKPSGNSGDRILSSCTTVDEAVAYLEDHKIALSNGHILFGDKYGHAVVVEWVDGTRRLINISDNMLMITNYLLSDTTKGNYPCPRYHNMQQAINELRNQSKPISLKSVGGVAARAVQQHLEDGKGRTGGTLYSTFINITDMEFKLVYKLDNSKVISLDLNKAFAQNAAQKIRMD